MSIKVYKASAGSGKTYTLVYEYIRYLFNAQCTTNGHTRREVMHNAQLLAPSALFADARAERPYSQGENMGALNLHRRVLAVTFTNKSTAEMKERIVKALYELAHGEKVDYVEKLRKDIPALKGVTDEVIGQRAMALLTDILQDYTQFRVSTIDGFFQQVVRSFARELNLNNQYQVELDTDSVLELAVDNMLAALGDEGNSQLLEWLTEFASERVQDDKSWNPRGAILELAKLILTEDYLSQKENFGFDLKRLKRLKEYREHIRKIIKKFEDDLKDVCGVAQGVLSGVDGKEFFGDNRISRFSYENLRGNKYQLTSTFAKGAESDDLENWCKVKYKKKVELQSVVTRLHECAKKIVELCDPKGDRCREWETAKIVNSYLYILGILNEIDEHVMEICREKDCLMISSTSDFINKIIDNSDTPFIYEKVGVQTDHFMIDEFQDTSRLQWGNFVPLLKETVSQGNESMIVGDVKQSIYRWRNGDWSILHEGIKAEFGDEVKDETLGKNFRSSKEIIEFNNRLYAEVPKLVDAQLKEQGVIEEDYLQGIYADSEQKVGKADAPKGYVRVEYFEDDEEDKELKWRVKSLDGEQMSASEIAGKSGEVEIRFDYYVTARDRVSANGNSYEMVHPYVMASGVVLDEEHFSNIEVNSGRVLSEDGNSVCLGIALPGMKENLGLKKDVIDIPESVVVKAVTDKFEIDGTYTVALTGLLDDVDISTEDASDKLDELESAFGKLSSASSKLVSGSKELAGGADKLADGAGDLADGADELAGGAKKLNKGSSKLAEGTDSLAKGASQLADGTSKLKESSGSLAEGISQLAGGAEALTEGAEGLKEGTEKAVGGAKDLSDGLSAISGNSEALKAGTAMIEDSVFEGATAQLQQALIASGKDPEEVKDIKLTPSNYKSVLSGIPGTGEIKSKLDGVEQYVSSVSSYTAGVDSAAEGSAAFYTSLQALDEGAGQVAEGAEGLDTGLTQLAGSLPDLSKGIDSLDSGASQVSGGASQVNSGAKSLSKGTSKLSKGASSLSKGSAKLDSGMAQLSEGAGTLAKGIRKFDNEGIKKLVSSLDTDELDDMLGRFSALSKASKGHHFMDGTTGKIAGESKIIFKTGAVR